MALALVLVTMDHPLALDFEYIYDGLNRLARVIDSNGNVISYEYDEVGNMVAIDRTTVAELPAPMITTIAPAFLNQLDTLPVIITGTGLLGGVVTTTTLGLTLTDFVGTDRVLKGRIAVADTAPLGSATLTVTTPIGFGTGLVTVLLPRPTIAAIHPTHATAAGGSSFTLSGVGFEPTTVVAIGGQPASNISVINGSLLTGTIPSGLPSPPKVDVVVTNPPGAARNLSEGFAYDFPFEMPSALAMLVSGSSNLTIRLIEPAATDLILSLSPSPAGVATLPASVMIPTGQRVAIVPITPIGEGSTMVTVTLGLAVGNTTLYVGDTDTEGDGLPDAVEAFFGTDPGNPDSNGNGTMDGQEDPDQDGLTHAQELAAGTDPFEADSDGDGLNDGAESLAGTDPLNPDSDGDGFSDGEENAAGSDPLEGTSLPVDLTASIGDAVGMSLTVENATNPSGPSIGEAVGPSFTVENATDPGGPAIGQAVGPSFTLENTTNPSGPAIAEAVGPVFSVDNPGGP